MQQIRVTKPEIRLVGINVRTSYQQELDWRRGRIFPCVQKYFHEMLSDKIPNRSKPGTTFCAYTEYSDDYTGSYTYFIGEEVSSFEGLLVDEFQKIVIPKQQYVKFTPAPASMPEVVVGAWNAIWSMSAEELGGVRRYQTDFEIYDERAEDHQNVVLDIYVGINPDSCEKQ